ncbi:MAG: DsbC family protein [Methylobacillus sp.]|nr:DsbC family protein [Methylobacillus sp.]
MLKRAMAILLAAMITTVAQADEASLKKAFETAYPKFTVKSVTKTPYAGLYEIVVGGQIVYTDEKLNFLLVEGSLIDTKSKRNITQERIADLTRVNFSALPFDKAIKVVKGNGSRKLVVFSDPDCPYCKQLEQKELVNVTDVTIYTFLYPIPQLHPNAADKARAIWCAPDKTKAWLDWMVRGQLAKGAECDSPVDELMNLGDQLGIDSTPTLIFENGRRALGAYPAKEINELLNAAADRK